MAEHGVTKSASRNQLSCLHANRRQEQAAAAGGNEMESVRSYFNGTGFERWNKIYGETDDVNKVPPCPHITWPAAIALRQRRTAARQWSKHALTC